MTTNNFTKITLSLIAIQACKDEVKRLNETGSWSQQLNVQERLFNLYWSLEDECRRAGLDQRKHKEQL